MLTEHVDLMPTLLAAAKLPVPPRCDPDSEARAGAGEADVCTEGVSLLPLISAPNTALKRAAFSQYPRRVRPTGPEWKDNSIIHKDRSTFTHMGCSVRTKSARLTEWVLWNQTALRPLWTFANGSSGVVARELYDHSADDAQVPDETC